MQSIVIRHLSGTKANQVEEIPLQGFREVLIGREANAQIRFDADREDLVSRNHARIVRDPADPNGFLLTDLDSRNGTFVNRQRIYGASRLQHGDRVQLGPSGPEFSFELDPPPAARPTRLADVPQTAIPPTREAFGVPVSGTDVPPGMPGTRPAGDAPRPVGRATVERMLGEVSTQMKGESRKTLWTAAIGILLLLLAGAGYLYYDHVRETRRKAEIAVLLAQNKKALDVASARQDEANKQVAAAVSKRSPEDGGQLEAARAAKKNADQAYAAALEENKRLKMLLNPPPPDGHTTTPPLATKSDEQIGKENVPSVILIEAAWKITDTGTGSQIYLYHHRNDLGACPQAPKSDYLPMFIEDQGTLSPVLSTLSNEGHNTPIVGTHSGTGFLVGSAGFFLTNRHVLAPWRATWNVASFTKKTAGLKVKNNSIVGCLTDAQFPSAWVPSEGSKMVVDKMESVMDAQSGAAQQQSVFSDRLKYNPLRTSVQGEAMINVTVAKTTQRYRANSVTLSEKHDIALGKVDLPGVLQGVTMSPEDSDAIRQGQHVVVMGYPAVSPDAFGVEVSRDMFTTKAHYSAIADPTLNSGDISKVISSGNSVRGVDGYISGGEVYQLGINTTGAGNSGGPVFDDKGRVIAVFYAGATVGGASVTYAVPIKFGKELIDNSPVIK